MERASVVLPFVMLRGPILPSKLSELVADQIGNNLNKKKNQQNDAVGQRRLPRHYNESVVHSIVQNEIRCKKLPVVTKGDLEDVVKEAFDCQECEKDQKEDCVLGRFLILLSEVDEVTSWQGQEEVEPAIGLHQLQVVLSDEKDEDQNDAICESEKKEILVDHG
jgi:hypothetical protein